MAAQGRQRAETLLLKAQVLMDSKRVKEADGHLQQALLNDNTNINVYETSIKSLLVQVSIQPLLLLSTNTFVEACARRPAAGEECAELAGRGQPQSAVLDGLCFGRRPQLLPGCCHTAGRGDEQGALHSRCGLSAGQALRQESVLRQGHFAAQKAGRGWLCFFY